MGQLPSFELVVDPPVFLNHYRLISEVLQREGVDHEPDDGAHLDSCGLSGFRLLGGGGFDLGHGESSKVMSLPDCTPGGLSGEGGS